jgi:tetratricopeptide (TPR) repeat protein
MLAIKVVHGANANGLPSDAPFPDPVLDEVAQSVRDRAPLMSLEATLAALDELDGLMASRPTLLVARRNGLVFRANLARTRGAHAVAIAAAERLIELLGDGPVSDPDDADDRLRAREGLALLLGEAGRKNEADATYRTAVALAARFGNPGLESRVRRNFGLFLAEQAQLDAARDMLTTSVAFARAASDPDLTGEALTAYGIFLQHQGTPDKARPLLEEAVSLLPPAEPTLLYARAHLEALKLGGACDCARHMPSAIAASVKALVARQLPSDLVADLRVELPDGGGKPNVNVFLARPPTDEEGQLLGKVIEHAVLDIQKRIRDEKTR